MKESIIIQRPMDSNEIFQAKLKQFMKKHHSQRLKRLIYLHKVHNCTKIQNVASHMKVNTAEFNQIPNYLDKLEFLTFILTKSEIQ